MLYSLPSMFLAAAGDTLNYRDEEIGTCEDVTPLFNGVS